MYKYNYVDTVNWISTAKRHRCSKHISYPSKENNTLSECKEFCYKEAKKAYRFTYNSNHMDVVGVQSDCACCSPSSDLLASDDSEVFTSEGDHIYRHV